MADEINISFTREELNELSLTYSVAITDLDAARPLSAEARQLADRILEKLGTAKVQMLRVKKEPEEQLAQQREERATSYWQRVGDLGRRAIGQTAQAEQTQQPRRSLRQ